MSAHSDPADSLSEEIGRRFLELGIPIPGGLLWISLQPKERSDLNAMLDIFFSGGLLAVHFVTDTVHFITANPKRGWLNIVPGPMKKEVDKKAPKGDM